MPSELFDDLPDIFTATLGQAVTLNGTAGSVEARGIFRRPEGALSGLDSDVEMGSAFPTLSVRAVDLDAVGEIESVRVDGVVWRIADTSRDGFGMATLQLLRSD